MYFSVLAHLTAFRSATLGMRVCENADCGLVGNVPWLKRYLSMIDTTTAW